jgi:hypothetical protein
MDQIPRNTHMLGKTENTPEVSEEGFGISDLE